MISTQHCEMIAQDLENLRKLNNLFPGRVKLIRYEDCALDPQSYAKRIYDFLGLSVTPTFMVKLGDL